MCLRCGCGEPFNQHGNPRAVALANLDQAKAKTSSKVTDLSLGVTKVVRRSRSSKRR